MVKSCVAYGCSTNRWTTGSGIQFHLFPLSRPELLKKWVGAVRREYWKPSKYSVICSAHFTKDSYLLRLGAIKQLLKDDAVPSLFSFPSHLQGKISRSRKLDQNKPTVSEKLGRSRKKLRKCDDYEEGDKMDAVVQQIIMNPPEVIIKEEPVVKEEAECDVGPGAQQNFEYVLVKEEPIEDPDESTSPAPEESPEQMGQDQELPLIIKEEIVDDKKLSSREMVATHHIRSSGRDVAACGRRVCAPETLHPEAFRLLNKASSVGVLQQRGFFSVNEKPISLTVKVEGRRLRISLLKHNDEQRHPASE